MKAKNYRSIRGQLYTREKYIHGSPDTRLVKFSMGEEKPDYNLEITLNANERLLMKDNALEAVRVSANRNLGKLLGSDYLFQIVVYPHHVLRENKMMTGAGADRLQEGMRRAFGKRVGRAAALVKGQPIVSVKTYAENEGKVRRILKIAASKVPKGAYVDVHPL